MTHETSPLIPKTETPYLNCLGWPLEKRCVYCEEGDGCDACDGRGWVLTQEGWRLVAFLRRHGLVALTLEEAGP